MPSYPTSRSGVGRGVKAPVVRGIDLFNAAQQKIMAAKYEENKNAGAGKVSETGLQATPTSSKVSKTAGISIHPKPRKETPAEYKARQAANAAAALQRERAKKLRIANEEFRRYCLANKCCLNCGWGGHVKLDCPRRQYVPVWAKDGELTFEESKPTTLEENHDIAATNTESVSDNSTQVSQ